MKILQMNLRKKIVKAIPDTFDDLWHLYNIIQKGDQIHARTKREIEPREQFGRPKKQERISVLLGVKVEKIDWDRLMGRLRIHGRICKAPKNVPLGPYHTLKIVANKPLTIVKEKWGKHHIDRLKSAREASEEPIIIVSIDDESFVVATTRQYGIEVRVEERIRLPGKLEPAKRNSALKEYFTKVKASLFKVWVTKHSPIVIIGVGFIKNGFVKFLRNEAKEVFEAVVDVKSVNNFGVAGIHEALRSGILEKAMEHLRVFQETEVIREVLKRLGKSEHTVTYGLVQVENAAELGAIETLIISDKMLRKTSDQERSNLEKLMQNVEQKGGRIKIISTEHEAGKELHALGGAAALLRFPIF
ncbi:MAG: mRNA surveillance protein pelota [Candidatus Bathyarchaeota archaeon]